jgi:predicted PurR-regulated permease PerM
MDGASNKGTEHVQSWLNKLKDSQDRKKDEKIRRYNDVVSRLIILLIGVCIVCVIVIAALIVQNEGLKKNYDQMVLVNQSTFDSQQSQLSALKGQIQSLQIENGQYKNFILSNRTYNYRHQVNVDPTLPKIVTIVYDNDQITLTFIDNTTRTSTFPTPDLTV